MLSWQPERCTTHAGSPATGLSQSAIRAYEQGQRHMANACAASVRSIQQVTCCSIDSLLF